MIIKQHPTSKLWVREDGAAGKTNAERGKKNAKIDELAGTLVDFLKTLKIAVEKEAK